MSVYVHRASSPVRETEASQNQSVVIQITQLNMNSREFITHVYMSVCLWYDNYLILYATTRLLLPNRSLVGQWSLDKSVKYSIYRGNVETFIEYGFMSEFITIGDSFVCGCCLYGHCLQNINNQHWEYYLKQAWVESIKENKTFWDVWTEEMQLNKELKYNKDTFHGHTDEEDMSLLLWSLRRDTVAMSLSQNPAKCDKTNHVMTWQFDQLSHCHAYAFNYTFLFYKRAPMCHRRILSGPNALSHCSI